ncbi:BMP family ABC transporter substrate-binding protein [Oryzobacter terrae]|uniref:nSTAND1 domain-containing NTPase n=1 Tax=Oryzobacter terrae TaxID=1620385 RepID=UPI00366EF163
MDPAVTVPRDVRARRPRVLGRLLGAVAVEVDGLPLDLGPPRQRALLALLLSRAGRVVDVDHLVSALWGEDPPRTAAHAVQVYVSDLRRLFLAACGRPLVLTRRPGYLIDLAPSEVDAGLVEAALLRARALESTGDRSAALEVLRPAAARCENSPLEDIREDGVRAEVVAPLDRLRTDVWDQLARCALGHGDLETAASAARRSLAIDPYGEEARAAEMEADYRRGRHAHALRSFATLRLLLAEELGVDPSPRLVQLHERMLLHDPSLDGTAEAAAGRNPYKGLRPFTEDDAADFFGRVGVVDDLVSRLEDGSRLLVLVGPSGGGKSSVLLAGLVPRLRHGAVLGLARCVVAMAPRAGSEDQLRAAVAAAEATAGEGGAVVLVIDQLEDLLAAPESGSVLTWLAREVEARGRLRVVAALRADHYDQPLEHPLFARVFTGAVVNLLQLTAAELEEVVRAPAARVGRGVEPALLAELIGDTVAQPAALPLLQYALTALFDHADGAVLTLADHRAVGGVRGALVRRAQAFRAELGRDEEAALAQLLVRLSDVDDVGRARRRVLRVGEVAATAPDPLVVSHVLGRLNDLRLVTYDRDADGGGTVELSHDALFLEWPWLRELVERHRTTIRRHQAFVTALDAWEVTGRDPAYLLPRTRLDEVSSWEREGVLVLTERERAFLGAGLEVARDAEQRAREEEAQRERMDRRSRRRLLMLCVAVVALVASVTVALVLAGRAAPHVSLVVHDDGDVHVLVERGLDDAGTGRELVREKVVVEPGATAEVDAVAARGHVDLVVSTALDIDFTTMARRHPSTRYLLVEREGEGPNVTVLAFADQESAYLAGAAAALTTRTGKVGFLGGVDTAVLRRFEAGFVAGAAAADPDVVVAVAYLSTPPRYDGFVDASLSAAGAQAMVDGGADVVYTASGTAQLGALSTVTRLAEENRRDLWVIGADVDAYHDDRWQTSPRSREHVLTSTVKRFDVATRAAVDDFLAGRLEAGRRVTDLADGGLFLATSGGHLEGVADRLAILRSEVVSGRVVVPCVPPGLTSAAAAAAAAGAKCPPG